MCNVCHGIESKSMTQRGQELLNTKHAMEIVLQKSRSANDEIREKK